MSIIEMNKSFQGYSNEGEFFLTSNSDKEEIHHLTNIFGNAGEALKIVDNEKTKKIESPKPTYFPRLVQDMLEIGWSMENRCKVSCFYLQLLESGNEGLFAIAYPITCHFRTADERIWLMKMLSAMNKTDAAFSVKLLSKLIRWERWGKDEMVHYFGTISKIPLDKWGCFLESLLERLTCTLNWTASDTIEVIEDLASIKKNTPTWKRFDKLLSTMMWHETHDGEFVNEFASQVEYSVQIIFINILRFCKYECLHFKKNSDPYSADPPLHYMIPYCHPDREIWSYKNIERLFTSITYLLTPPAPDNWISWDVVTNLLRVGDERQFELLEAVVAALKPLPTDVHIIVRLWIMIFAKRDWSAKELFELIHDMEGVIPEERHNYIRRVSFEDKHR